MRITRAFGTLLAVVGLLGLSSTAHAQLAKQGSFGGSYVWEVSSKVHQLESGHIFTHDVYKGTFYNDADEGFLHESQWTCPGTADLVDGKGTSRGYCIVTDKDNDKAYNIWEGTVDMEAGFEANFRWTGGTGKYKGIQGNNTFRGAAIELTDDPPVGIGIMKATPPPRKTSSVRAEGEWRLP
jgi:hypothetical protein